ncbi:MAG: beta-lactamase family protein [Deltaproteobacteria bacterium]|nr:beta-lactamase family protein [Deltaproteobacteria bacterium]
MTRHDKLRYGSPEEAGMVPDRIENVKKLAKGWVTEGQTPSLVVLAARRGVIFLHEAFGKLTPEADSPPLQKDSLFPLSSITKPITATAIMILVEDGLLGLNRPVVDYIPEICGEGAEEVLVHHLLTHTSGYNDMEVIMYMIKMNKENPPEIPPCDGDQHPLIHTLLTRTYQAPLWKPPGEVMSYCTHNYRLLGEIIRRVSGCSLADFAQDRIFKPLRMMDTYYIVPESLVPRIIKRPPEAPDAQRVNRFMEGIDSRQMQETPYADRGIWSTALDMAVFGQMFLNGGKYGDIRILSRPTVSEMTRNQIPGIQAVHFDNLLPEASWGYGWAIQSNIKWKYWMGSLIQPQKCIIHPGFGGVMMWIDLKEEIVGVYFSITLEVTPMMEHKWNFDLFLNAVTASVSD